jgi:tetrahydromethanopterin S-methyltransferase subunit A
MQGDHHGAVTDSTESHPAIVGDVVFGSAESPVAVCTLGSRSLLAPLSGRPEIAVAGRVFTENVGIERMVQNLAAFESVRFLIVCGRETPHRVGQTILALHRSGLDACGRVVGSEAPEPLMPNLRAEQLRAFRTRVELVDMIGETDVEAILSRARALASTPAAPEREEAQDSATAASPVVEQIQATRDPASAWIFDPVGYYLVLVDRARQLLRVEQYSQEHRLLCAIEGRAAEEISHTIVRLGQVTLLAHAAYLGRELAKAEAALRLGLEYEQDRPLSRPARKAVDVSTDAEEVTRDDGPGDRRAP